MDFTDYKCFTKKSAVLFICLNEKSDFQFGNLKRKVDDTHNQKLWFAWAELICSYRLSSHCQNLLF